jgi:hypothetical protein
MLILGIYSLEYTCNIYTVCSDRYVGNAPVLISFESKMYGKINNVCRLAGFGPANDTVFIGKKLFKPAGAG